MWIFCLGKGYLPALQRTVLKKSMAVLLLRLRRAITQLYIGKPALSKRLLTLLVPEYASRRTKDHVADP